MAVKKTSFLSAPAVAVVDATLEARLDRTRTTSKITIGKVIVISYNGKPYFALAAPGGKEFLLETTIIATQAELLERLNVGLDIVIRITRRGEEIHAHIKPTIIELPGGKFSLEYSLSSGKKITEQWQLVDLIVHDVDYSETHPGGEEKIIDHKPKSKAQCWLVVQVENDQEFYPPKELYLLSANPHTQHCLEHYYSQHYRDILPTLDFKPTSKRGGVTLALTAETFTPTAEHVATPYHPGALARLESASTDSDEGFSVTGACAAGAGSLTEATTPLSDPTPPSPAVSALSIGTDPALPPPLALLPMSVIRVISVRDILATPIALPHGFRISSIRHVLASPTTNPTATLPPVATALIETLKRSQVAIAAASFTPTGEAGKR